MSTIWDDIKFNAFHSGRRINFLIWINIAVFLTLEIFAVFEHFFTGKENIYNYVSHSLAIPSNLQSLLTHPWTIVTHMFMHADISHIFYNMLWFYFIGQIFEEFLGGRKLTTAYFLGGLAGAFFFILSYNIFPIYAAEKLKATAIGASACIMSVIVGTATLLPEYSVSVLFLGSIRLKWIALFYVLTSFIGITGSNSGGELAHLGGALMGFIYVKQLQNGNDFGKIIESWFKPRSKLKVATNNTGKPLSRKPRQEDIDRILDKISQSGYDSLSKQEKETLFRASNEEKS